ncbi:MAG TPA: tetratricopeptide repeat protein [Acidimicrobiales bacterium]|nr:tetratricopeptide repeat protein [Acidimicrobiales bacterium]
MSDRLLVDHGDDGRVSVSAWFDGELAPTPASQPFELCWPLDAEALDDLRWYLEDYLRAPFGVYGDRGPKVAAQLRPWGEAIFGTLFGSGPARDAYVRVRERNAGAEVVLRSSAPAFLGLPWELLADPARPTPLALDLMGVTRSLPAERLPAAFSATGERLRVLMVICRPRAGADVGYRMIARPLLERLDAVRGQVDLAVLRPPTLETLERRLAEAKAEGQPFQIVHFDGHGVLAGRGRQALGAAAPVAYLGTEVEGVLAFEKPGGGGDDVPAGIFAQVLSAAEVPVVVLNACQSGAVGTELEAAVATRLLQEGAASVVAMGYTVYAVAAAEFMAAFYERLFAGEGITQAVAAGRRRLHQRPERHSPKGLLPLADWMVPVHYLRRDVQFPNLQAERPRKVSLENALDHLREAPADQPGDGLQPVEAFVGRDGLFYELEVAARLQRVIVLHGPAGTGKTELAKAFGRWWRDTGGVEDPDWVIFHSFEPGVASFGLDGVVANIGLRVFGADFARLEAGQRRGVVERLLAERRLLLVWDNFESVFTMPDPEGATPALDEAGRQELREFLGRLAGGGESSVIITTRTKEAWLGEVRRIPVGGLDDDEAIEYANNLLAPFPDAGPQRATPAFGELLRWLDGHPLSMRLVLPHLETTEPEQLLAALAGTEELPRVVEDEAGRTTSSLGASITYSFDHLDPPTRRLLLALCLFSGVADLGVLAMFSQVEGTPQAFAGFSQQEWAGALDDAARVGLLTPMGAGMYRNHPAVPAYVAALWRKQDPGGYGARRDAATRALLTAYAVLGMWLRKQITGGDAAFALTLIGHQYHTLGHLLGYALENALWAEAQAIGQPLSDYWNARGLSEEAGGWVDRVRVAAEAPDGVVPELDSPAGALWLFFVGSQAGRQVRSGQLDAAEETYSEILATLDNQAPSDACAQRLATTHHQLGIVAEERGRLDEAEEWYRRSLGITERLGDQPGMASSYHQLGIVAEERGRLDEAEEWYRRSLGITEQLGEKCGMARSYHQLGRVAEERGRLDEAEEWYRRSLGITERLGDQAGMATTYHQLGRVAVERGDLDEALKWAVRCVASFDEFPHPTTAPGRAQLDRLTAALGADALARCWRTVTGRDVPQVVRDFIGCSDRQAGGADPS